MKYKTFKSILKALEKQHEVDRQINKVLQLAQSDTYFMGATIDEIGQAFNMIFIDEFGEEGVDLINWWMYEDVDKFLYDTKTDEVVDDLTELVDLWKYISKENEEKVDDETVGEFHNNWINSP